MLDVEDDSIDDVLGLILKKCEMWVRTVCGIYDVDKNLELVPLDQSLKNVVDDLAIIRYNKLGSEGLSNETVGPLNMNYDDVPHNIALILNRYKKVRF